MSVSCWFTEVTGTFPAGILSKFITTRCGKFAVKTIEMKLQKRVRAHEHPTNSEISKSKDSQKQK